MTKKKALKKIMSLGIQRNEAQKLLLKWHNEGFNNGAIPWMVFLEQCHFVGAIKMVSSTTSSGR